MRALLPLMAVTLSWSVAEVMVAVEGIEERSNLTTPSRVSLMSSVLSEPKFWLGEPTLRVASSVAVNVVSSPRAGRAGQKTAAALLKITAAAIMKAVMGRHFMGLF